MTSRDSLTNKPVKKRVSADMFAFTSSFNAGLILINAVVLVILVSIYFTIVRGGRVFYFGADDIAYMFMDGSLTIPIKVILSFQAVITATMSFAFMFNKRASATYLSLPISRGGLFISKYCAGFILSILPYVIFMLMLLRANISTFGASEQLTQGFFMFLSAGITGIFATFSIASLICLLAGTITEGIVFGLIMLFAPTLAAYATTNIFKMFLYGSTFGADYAFGFIGMPLEDLLLPYLPMGSLQILLMTYPPIKGEGHNVPFIGPAFNGFVTTLVWLVLSIGIVYLARRVFKRYKAEISGMHGTNRVLNAVATYTLTYFIFGFCISNVIPMYFGGAPASLLFILTIFITIAVFALCRFLFTLSAKDTFSVTSLRQFGICFGCIAAMCVVCRTGGLGYTNYQPKAENIQRAQITYSGAPDYIVGESSEYGNYRDRLGFNYGNMQERYTRDFRDLWYETPEDISTVLALHKGILENAPALFDEKDKMGYQVRVFYEQKNGKGVERLYGFTMPEPVKALASIDGTEAVRNRIDESLTILANKTDSPVYVTDCLFGNEHTLNPADREALFRALSTDIGSLPLEAKYYPSTAAQAVITMPRPNPSGGYEAVRFLGATRMSVSRTEYDMFSSTEYYSASTAVIHLYITEDYPETLAFLKQKGLFTEINPADSITDIQVWRYQLEHDAYLTMPMYFRSYTTEIYNRPDALKLESQYYAQLLPLCKTHYYTDEGGYLVQMRTDRNTYVVMFLPESSAPGFIMRWYYPDRVNPT